MFCRERQEKLYGIVFVFNCYNFLQVQPAITHSCHNHDGFFRVYCWMESHLPCKDSKKNVGQVSFLNTLNTGKISKPEHRSDEVSALLSVYKRKTCSWSELVIELLRLAAES